MAEKRQMSFLALLFALPIAVSLDILSFIPFLGNLICLLGIGVFYLIFMFTGILSPTINISAGITTMVEAIPIIGALPGVTAFILIVYFSSRVQEGLKP